MAITTRTFGLLPSGEEVTCYTLSNSAGMQASILNFGATIQSVLVPDKNGTLADVVCGYDDLDSYRLGDGYQGAIVGRVGNRIGGARFTLLGETYTLYANDGKNHLHGGRIGFSHRLWDAEPLDGDEPSLRLSLFSPDGEEGYPGNLSVVVTYTLSADNRLSIYYRATTDKATILNLTNHAYWNLGGFDSGSVLDHVLTMDADGFVETGADLIPTGTVLPVAGTPFDFRRGKSLGRDFFDDYEPLHFAGGYDHCMLFSRRTAPYGEILHRATLYDPQSGRKMRMLTNQPGVQLYTANFMKNSDYPFKGGYPQKPQNAVCLETQHMPDSINQEGFTDTVLRPGEVYEYTTVYAFSAQ